MDIKELHTAIKEGKAKLRPLSYILKKAKRKGYNKNYVRDWFRVLKK